MKIPEIFATIIGVVLVSILLICIVSETPERHHRFVSNEQACNDTILKSGSLHYAIHYTCEVLLASIFMGTLKFTIAAAVGFIFLIFIALAFFRKDNFPPNMPPGS